ncbi:MAG: site-specific integrase [Albidovulum sp.]
MISRIKLTKTAVDQADVRAVRYSISDTEIPGYKLVVSPSGKKAFYLRYRVVGGRGGTIREPKIGDFGAITAERARSIALDWVAIIRQGGDPSGARQERRAAPTMSVLFQRYLSDHARIHKKAGSIANDEMLIKNLLQPALGNRKVAEVSRSDISTFHQKHGQTPYQANRALALLSKAFSLAEVWDWRPDGSNPTRHVKKYPEEKRQRYLSGAEFARLGAVLRQAEGDGYLPTTNLRGGSKIVRHVPISPYVVAAIRLLLFTGARRGEILGLRWDWVDLEESKLRLPDSKTGSKTIYLDDAALDVIRALPENRGNPFVIAGGKPGCALVNLKDPWEVIRTAAALKNVRIHDLRHSFASIAVSGGLSLPIIGALLGHTQPGTTARYAHLADDPLRAATAQISAKIRQSM